MGLLDDIRAKVGQRQYEFSKHAVDQGIIREISVAEVEEAIANRSEVTEDYPEDKYGPNCLDTRVHVRRATFACAVQLCKPPAR